MGIFETVSFIVLILQFHSQLAMQEDDVENQIEEVFSPKGSNTNIGKVTPMDPVEAF